VASEKISDKILLQQHVTHTNILSIRRQ